MSIKMNNFIKHSFEFSWPIMRTKKFSKYLGIKLSKISGDGLDNVETNWALPYLGQTFYGLGKQNKK